ncbi:unnamed protein product [Dovyalis caffra]|uniref:Uncharacterized protein n=1 Tax=Dovyalis caffra TaxID=77055 RepID=A0AAV1S8L3_9ROSI|nr:unnamed protein product [Dovyalis caffra]
MASSKGRTNVDNEVYGETVTEDLAWKRDFLRSKENEILRSKTETYVLGMKNTGTVESKIIDRRVPSKSKRCNWSSNLDFSVDQGTFDEVSITAI